MQPAKAPSTTKELLAFFNEGETLTWATRHQLLAMVVSFLTPRKKMAIFTAVLVAALTLLDVVTFFHGPLILAQPVLDAAPGHVLNLLSQSNEYGSFPGSFFGYVPPLLSLSMAFLALYWLGALVKHEWRLFTTWKAERMAL